MLGLRQMRSTVTWGIATAITVGVTLVLCWWPFNFRPVNDVFIDAEQGKAFFNMGLVAAGPYNRGHALTRKFVQFDGKGGASFQFFLTPLTKPNGLGCILALYDGGEQASFIIAQWQEHLALRVRSLDAKKGYREVGLKNRLAIGKSIELAIVTNEKETRVIVDGQMVAEYRGFSLLAPAGQTTGRLVLGNDPTGSEPWHGSIEWVVIYDQALLTATKQKRDVGPVIDDRFARNDSKIAGQEKGLSAFSVPSQFEPVVSTFLAPISTDRLAKIRTWIDIFLNIIGFMPFGFCVASVSGQITSHPARKVGITVLASFLFSFIIESGQVFLPSRHSSQLDLLCNTIGASIVAGAIFLRSGNRKQVVIS